MTFPRMLLATCLATSLMMSGAGFAQTTTPAAPAAAAPASAAPAMDKKAISKACSDEATQQGLHGKARKTFRSKCKAQKMKSV
jgi:hypothetical protein